MKVIELDATRWATTKEFFSAILNAVGAPDWHGKNLNALQESMIWGGINALEPPYAIHISGASATPDDVRDIIETARWAIAKARKEYQMRNGRDVEVAIEVES